MEPHNPAASFLAHQAALDKVCRLDGNCIVLSTDDGVTYQIELDRCASHQDILGWVVHLLEKDWVSKAMLDRFIAIACAVHGLEDPVAPA